MILKFTVLLFFIFSSSLSCPNVIYWIDCDGVKYQVDRDTWIQSDISFCIEK